MPRLAIPTIVAREQAGGTVRAPMPGGLDVRGLMAGVGALGEGMDRARINQDRVAEELRQAQERKAEKLSHDEARLAATNALSAADSYWVEKLTTAKRDSATNAAGFTAGVLKDWDQWAKQQEDQLPELAKPIVRQQLAAKKAQIHAQAFQFEVGQRDAAIRQGYADGAQQDVKTVGVAPAQFEARLAARIGLARTLDLPEAERAKLIDATTESMAQAAAMGLVDRDAVGFLERAGVRSAKGPKGKQGGQQQDAADRIASDPILRHLTPQALRQTVDRASMIVAQQEAAAAQEQARREAQAQAAAERRAREATQAWDVLYRMSRDGLAVDPRDPGNQALIGKLQGTPYASAFEKMQAQTAAGASAALKPVEAQRRELDALYAARREGGASQALNEEIAHREKVLNGAESSVKQDPLRAYTRRFADSAPTPLNTSSPQALVESIAARNLVADEASRWSGAPSAPIYAEEVGPIRQYMETLPPRQRGALAADLAAKLSPGAAAGFAMAMGKESREMELSIKAGANRTSLGRLTSELVFAGAQAMKDQTSTKGKKEPEVVAARWKATIAEKLGDVFADQRTADDFRDMALHIAHAKAAEAGGSVDIDEAVALALHGSLAEGRGRTVVRDGRPYRVPLPLPSGMDESALDDRLRALTPKDMGGDQVLAAGVPMKSADFVRALPGQELVPVRPGVYSVIVGGRPVLRQDGRRLEIGVR